MLTIDARDHVSARVRATTAVGDGDVLAEIPETGRVHAGRRVLHVALVVLVVVAVVGLAIGNLMTR